MENKEKKETQSRFFNFRLSNSTNNYDFVMDGAMVSDLNPDDSEKKDEETNSESGSESSK